MTQPSPNRSVKPSEEGFTLLAVMFLIALMTIWLAVALPQISKQIQRDREVETIHRGKQYIRAIKLYYKQFGAYPTSVDALVKPTNNIRFLRKKYTDPITGKDDWKPILVGQNKAPTMMGFFGVPIGGVCGSAPVNPFANTNNSTGAGSAPTGSPTASTSGSGMSGSSASSTGTDSTGTATTPSPFDADGNCLPAGAGLNSGSSNSTTPTNQTSSSGSQTSSDGTTFGGGPIMGFSPNSSKKSILVYKKKQHYNQWEFVYDPLAEQMLLQMSTMNTNNGLNSNGTTGAGTGPTGSPGMGGGYTPTPQQPQQPFSPTQ